MDPATTASDLSQAVPDPEEWESLIYGLVMLVVTGLLVLSSLVTIGIICANETLRDVIGHYLISLAFSDLAAGCLITPFAVYAAFNPSWKYGSENSFLCKIQAYIQVFLWSTVAYIFMWIGVDRYAALNKPTRYEVEQTLTRCKCWILFTWISAALLSCPILAADMKAQYYEETFLCVLDWGATRAYSATLASLVLLPSLIGTCYSYWYIFYSIRNPEDLEDTQKSMLESDQTYMMTFFVILSFCLSWGPWFVLRGVEALSGTELRIRALHFSLMWLAVAGGPWKLLIYATMSRDFRWALRNCSLGCLCLRAGPPPAPHPPPGYHQPIHQAYLETPDMPYQ